MRRRRVLEYALACSLALHLALVFLVPLWERQAAPPADRKALNARLLPKPEPPAPRVEPRPEPPAPKPAPPPTLRPKVPPVPAPSPPAKPAPAPAPEPAPVIQVSPQAPATPDAPRVAPAPPTPTVAAAPARTRPEAGSAAPEVQEADMIARYRVEVIEAAVRLRRYPLLARENNWTGTSGVRLSVAADGRIATLETRKGSGHRVLDEEALAMIRGAHGKVPVPPGLRGKPFSIDVPVIFDLKD